MSLLKKIEDIELLIAELKVLVGVPEEPIAWYLNIPKEGIMCRVSDVFNIGYLDRWGETRGVERVVFDYDKTSTHPFTARSGDRLNTTMIKWRYATPI